MSAGSKVPYSLSSLPVLAVLWASERGERSGAGVREKGREYFEITWRSRLARAIRWPGRRTEKLPRVISYI